MKYGVHYFVNINNGKMYLSKLGVITKKCCLEIPQYYPFVIFGEYVIMPNYVHGIIIINKPYDRANEQQQNTKQITNKCGPQSKKLGTIICGFKIGVTKFARNNDIPFEWQARFHDRVLRINNDKLNMRRNYIKNNPINWWNNMCNP